MAEERAKRKLSALLSADVKGYSRLMGQDEAGTVIRIKEYRALMTDFIQRYRGRVVDSPGDNILAEFASVVDATECAVKVQQELKNRNAELPNDSKMEFRIGINLGDVIEDGERIYGDGVNIAARIESLAEAGGICISGTSYDQVKNKLNLGYKNLGEHSVKNIAEPVRIYRVLPESEAAGKVIGEKRKSRKWIALAAAIVLIAVVGGLASWFYYLRQSTKIEPATVEKMAYPLPDKPSIAVLPFDNLSGVPDQDYIADGITENIITALSYIPQIFVIARNSTFTYKGKAVKAQEVAEDLGVRYILEGSVQKAGNRLRIMAQLIDAASGRHLWADRYDRDLQDLFALQDEITLKIVLALEVELSTGVQTRLTRKTMPNFEAWSYYVRGNVHRMRHTKADNAKAREFFERAASQAPGYAPVITALGWTYWEDAFHGWSETRGESLLRAVELAKKALALDDADPEIHALWGAIYLRQRRYEQAIAEGEKSVALGPNKAFPHLLLGTYLYHIGRYKEALPLVRKAMRLDPYYPTIYLELLGHVYLSMEAYEKAVEAFKVLVVREPQSKAGHRGLAIAYIRLGRKEQARSEVAEVLRLFPEYSLEVARKQAQLMNMDPTVMENDIEALREAGLPEYSPIALPDKPSIAVLPFVNMSGDPEQEYFNDGLTEDLITDLSKFRDLFVISRNSVFTYKGQAIKPEQVRKDLGVRYMLEGSVRKAGNRVRITAQLIDTTTGGHLWAERYDRELKDIFTLQDEITQQIVSALDVKFEQIEQERALRKDTANLNAFDYNLRGWWYYQRFTKENNEQARRMFEQATEIEPKFANAYAGLGFTYYEQWANQWRQDPRSLDRAFELAKKAISLNDSLSSAYTLLSHVSLWRKQHAQAIAEQERAIALNPNDADGYADLAEILVWAGRPEEALGLVEKAMRLNPHYPVNYLFTLGFAYSTLERYEEAMATLKRALTRSPDDLGIHLMLAVIYSEIGREEEARAHVAEAQKINPQLTMEVLEQIIPFKDTAIFERMGDSLRRAGLK
jgi:adenylate cyclase